MQSTLYVVATPIGNLEDITLRALRALKESDAILCEDTRVTKKLLSYYGITVPCISYHAHSGIVKNEKIFELLREGKTLSLVSDAGTPTISDPGAYLIAEVRKEFRSDVSIEVVPGASAVVAALSVAGVHADTFVFLGFPPHKKGRKTFFDAVKEEKTVVFYESPHRFLKAVDSLKERLETDRQVTVVRELTKIHEEVVQGTIQEVLEHYTDNPSTVRGEFVIVVSGVV
jgi:16S rRNA (cytidine1402-2'-O)-methyltransferase